MTRYDQNYSQGRGDLSGAKEDAKAKASQVSEQAKQQAKGQLEKGRDTTSVELEKVAHAVQAAASDLNEQNQPGLSRYVTDIADSMSSLAESLRGKNVDELVHEVTGIARRNPTLFIAGSVAIGLGLARFAKASSKQNMMNQDDTAYSSYSEMSGSSRDDLDWPEGYGDTDYDADYSSRMSDFSTKESESITGDTLTPGDNGKTNTLGGRRYE